ncbi:hypothetical protein [Novosphingobium arvoryzae]|uniref:UrcA family protein n=1 Tax=Novosphingobium arvoryzae TaxID=1256514 RepID=A0A918VD24_9SPHN|nr:hypothetical protein [Novosphingobium arvoryzae]GGZ90258.1 hypothetical protein GCM10011617_06450 [Novosphingobium arvoryzae]
MFQNYLKINSAENKKFAKAAVFFPFLIFAAASAESPKEAEKKDPAVENAPAADARRRDEIDSHPKKSSEKSVVTRDDETDSLGTTRRAWKRRCTNFVRAKNECAVSDRLRSCIETKMGEIETGLAATFCEGSEPGWMVEFEKK